jgi:hypothetical protein
MSIDAHNFAELQRIFNMYSTSDVCEALSRIASDRAEYIATQEQNATEAKRLMQASAEFDKLTVKFRKIKLRI